MNLLNQILTMTDDSAEDRRGTAPKTGAELTPEQRSALARCSILGSAVMQHPAAYFGAMATLALSLPIGAPKIDAEAQVDEMGRLAESCAADLFRLFPKAPVAPQPAVNPRGYSAEQRSAIKRILMLGPALDGAPSAEGRNTANRLASTLDRVEARLGRPVGQGYSTAIEAELIADAEQLIVDLERLF